MPNNLSRFLFCNLLLGSLLFPQTIRAEPPKDIDLPPEIIEESPVLEKWLQETPNILQEIRHNPSFRTRLNFGFVVFPSNDDITGLSVGIEDIFLGKTGLTLSADYRTSFNSDRISLGTDIHYFLFPLGNYVNIAPLVGYRYIQSNDFNTDGVNLGLRLMLALSRTGAANISIAQSFVSPGSNEEVGLFSVAIGYSVTSRIRLSTDWEWQNSQEDNENSFSIGLQHLF